MTIPSETVITNIEAPKRNLAKLELLGTESITFMGNPNVEFDDFIQINYGYGIRHEPVSTTVAVNNFFFLEMVYMPNNQLPITTSYIKNHEGQIIPVPNEETYSYDNVFNILVRRVGQRDAMALLASNSLSDAQQRLKGRLPIQG